MFTLLCSGLKVRGAGEITVCKGMCQMYFLDVHLRGILPSLGI